MRKPSNGERQLDGSCDRQQVVYNAQDLRRRLTLTDRESPALA